MSKTITKQKFQIRLQNTHPNYKIIGQCTNATTPTQFECAHNHVFTVQPSALLTMKYGCQQCMLNHKRRIFSMTRNEFIKKLKTANPTILLSGPYYKSSSHMLFLCTVCGTKRKTIGSKLIKSDFNNRRGCPVCAEQRKYLHRDHTRKFQPHPAIDITYGENKIIHTGSSLMAYQGLTNYMDAYRHLQAKTNTQDVLRDKSLPVAGTIYQNFKGSLKNIEHRNLILVKSQAGTPIGAFVGSDIHVKEIGGTDFSNSIITIDDHKLFVYDCSYTIYPTSALKATGQNTKAPRTQKQDSVKTSSNTGEVPPTDSAKPVKHKNK